MINAASLFAVSTAANAQAVDTSEWLCEFCPFEDGSRTEVEVGASSVSDDSAYFGDATGYDEEGVYAEVDASGSIVSGEHRLVWEATDLGLDSRSAKLQGGNPGSFDYYLAYSELPRRQFDTTRTIFVESGGDSLSLPGSWVRAPLTSGLSELDASLVSRNIESDRSLIEVGGRYLASIGISATADYRHREQDGVKMLAGASFTNASLLPAPFGYETDEVDLGLRYQFQNGSVSLGWYLSDFSNSGNGISWQNPFTTVAGAESSSLARAPDSRFQQLSLRGAYSLPEQKTHISASFAAGQIEQDAPFLPYTSNVNVSADPLPRGNLGGEVDTQNFAVAVTSRPLAKTRVKFSYRYDERDNSTPQSTWNRVIVDSFLSGELEQNLAYSYERSSLKLSGDYDLFDDLRLSAGYERRSIDRDFQEVAEQTEDTGWGRARWRPLGSLEIDVKGGASRRDVDRYDEALASSYGQNPLLRKYNLAYRYREFGELNATWSPDAVPVSIGLTTLFTDDSYTRSLLGVTDGNELRVALDVGWMLSEQAFVYVHAGFDEIESEQSGSQQFGTADWLAENEDSFDTIGAGLKLMNISDRIDLRFDYLRSEGASEIEITTIGSATSSFPELETSLDYLRLALSYERSARLAITAELRWQRFETSDWALAGVGPATMPTILTLGAMPYDEDVLVLGIGFRYRLAPGD